MDSNSTSPSTANNGVRRKSYKKSPYLFPAYNFAEAKLIAQTIENDGGGALTEETLAMNLHQSAKSSGFRLKVLTAKQFQLLTRQGSNLSTTPLAKAIFKPANDNEQKESMKQSFLAIPLFRAVADRFKGQPLPQGDNFRNILEREFKIDNQRVSSAERVLIDSARDTGVMVDSGGKTYLTTDVQTMRLGDQHSNDYQPPPPGYKGYNNPPQNNLPQSQSRGMLDISISDLALLDKNDFKAVWDALGKVVQAKGEQELKTRQQSINQKTESNIEQVEENKSEDE
jgi:hypothetical protein